jgi:hypothetical protein
MSLPKRLLAPTFAYENGGGNLFLMQVVSETNISHRCAHKKYLPRKLSSVHIENMCPLDILCTLYTPCALCAHHVHTVYTVHIVHAARQKPWQLHSLLTIPSLECSSVWILIMVLLLFLLYLSLPYGTSYSRTTHFLLACSFSLHYNTICHLMICHRLKTKDLENCSSSNISLIWMTIFLKSLRLLLARLGSSSVFQLILGQFVKRMQDG